MELTKDDVHICRVLFNKETHPMAIALYGERAREIYKYSCNRSFYKEDFYERRIGHVFEIILQEEPKASFFFENQLIDFSCFNGIDIFYILTKSPIAEKIWDSNMLDKFLYKIPYYGISNLLIESNIAEKIWDSTKLDPYLHKLDNFDIKKILQNSPISDKIKESGKLKLQTIK